MADILLTHGYFLEEDEKEREIMKPYPPLGLLCISAYLKRSGFGVDVLDTTFATRADLYGRLSDDPGGVVGIYTNLITRRAVLDIVTEAKRHGWTVILGGPESANYPAEYLRRGADVVVIGEGEETLAELLPGLARNGPTGLHGIAGTVFVDERGEVRANPPRAQIRDLDSMPWPDREAVDSQLYVDVWRKHHGMGSLNMITARGCPYRCRWCSHAVFGYTHRRRSHVDCAAELAHLVETYAPDQVWYADDVFTIHHRWLSNYAAELKRLDLKVPFETISRADRMMNANVLETLAEMGCWRIWIGSESGSQRVLDAMERGVTVEQVQWATEAAKRHGIEVGMFLMWGYEGETFEDIEATVEHVKKVDPDVFFTNVAYPIKNTVYFDEVASRARLPIPWEQATDRDYVVGGRLEKSYYALADRWLRSAVEAKRLAASNRAQAAVKEEEAAEAKAALAAVMHPAPA